MTDTFKQQAAMSNPSLVKSNDIANEANANNISPVAYASLVAIDRNTGTEVPFKESIRIYAEGRNSSTFGKSLADIIALDNTNLLEDTASNINKLQLSVSITSATSDNRPIKDTPQFAFNLDLDDVVVPAKPAKRESWHSDAFVNVSFIKNVKGKPTKFKLGSAPIKFPKQLTTANTDVQLVAHFLTRPELLDQYIEFKLTDLNIPAMSESLDSEDFLKSLFK